MRNYPVLIVGAEHHVKALHQFIDITEHVLDGKPHKVVVNGIDPRDPRLSFLTCLDHGNSNWVHTSRLNIKDLAKETTSMTQQYWVTAADVIKSTSTTVTVRHLTTREVDADSYEEAIETMAHLPGEYFLIKNEEGQRIIYFRPNQQVIETQKTIEVIKKPYRIAIVGHRPDKLGGWWNNPNQPIELNPIESWCLNEIINIITPMREIDDIADLCGMAAGADMLGAKACETVGIPVIPCVPFEGQQRRWTKPYRNEWARIIKAAAANGNEKIIVTKNVDTADKGEVARSLYRRNTYMVKRADLVIAITKGDEGGGTAHALSKAEEFGVKVIKINPNDCPTPHRPAPRPRTQAPATTQSSTSARVDGTLYFDGASRGNPGPASVGAVLKQGDNILSEHASAIGRNTNNVAEWRALLAGLEMAATAGITHLVVRGDSLLVINQCKGLARVKDEKLRLIYEQVKIACDPFQEVVFEHVRREENLYADSLCNKALNQRF